jgi:hypothetical protein
MSFVMLRLVGRCRYLAGLGYVEPCGGSGESRRQWRTDQLLSAASLPRKGFRLDNYHVRRHFIPLNFQTSRWPCPKDRIDVKILRAAEHQTYLQRPHPARMQRLDGDTTSFSQPVGWMEHPPLTRTFSLPIFLNVAVRIGADSNAPKLSRRCYPRVS